MKKNNKIILNTLLISIAFFAFSINVNAAGATCNILTGSPDNYTKSNGQTIKTFKYTAQCSDGTTCLVWCLDPAKTSNKNDGTFTKQDNESLAKVVSQLYEMYSSNQYCQSGDAACSVKFQTALRIIEFSGGISGYSPRSGAQGSETNFAYQAFKSGSADNCYGGTCASAIAQEAIKSASSSSLGNTQTSFEQSGGDIVLRIVGKSKEPSKITYTINGNSYSYDKPQGQLNGNVFTTVVPSNILTSLSDCVELNGDIAYPKDSNDNDDLSNFPLFKSNSSEKMEIQNYAGACFPSNSGNNGNDNDSHITASTSVKSDNNSKPILCDAEAEYEDENKPIPCKTNAVLECKEPATNDPKDSKVFSYNEGTIDGTGITDWETCIIHNTDTNGNSYDVEMNNLSSYASIYEEGYGWTDISDAKFCNISCKENYEIKMPASRDNVKFGTYFAFDIAPNQYPRHAIVGVKSEKQCVTSGANNVDGGIEIDKYEKRVLSLRKQQIDFVNLYNYFDAVYNELKDRGDNFANGNYDQYTYVSKSSRRSEFDDRSGYINSSSSNWSSWKYDDWKNSNGWSDFDDQDVVNSVSFNYPISYTQYSLSSDSVYADITERYVNGYTSNSFSTLYSAYLKTNGIDFYCSKFGLCNLDKINATMGYSDSMVNYINKTSANTTFDYSYNSDGEYNDGWAYAEIEFQTAEQRKEAYNNMLRYIENIKNAAYGRIQSLSVQIAQQGEGINNCTKQITQLDDYNFDPQIKWDYAEDYVNMMNNPNNLEILTGDGNVPTKSSPAFSYCDESYTGDAAGVFNCGSGENNVTFKYLNSEGRISSDSETHYNRVSRVGITVKYDCNNSDNYCYYGSNTAFYTYPPDGKVTTDGNTARAAIIEDDGLVFPVSITSETGNKPFSLKFENIGQYISGDKKGNLGRIMGDNGVLNGDYKNNAVCYYKVYKPNSNPACDKIVEEECMENGEYTKNQSQFDACIKDLLEVTEDGNPVCCDIAYGLSEKVSETGLWSVAANTEYTNVCEGPKTCTGFKISDMATGVPSNNTALVNSNGDLQFTVRTVSLNNLFPNGDKTKGLNWSTGYMSTVRNGDKQSRYIGNRNLAINEIIERIQNDGDSIYGGVPDYSCVLTPKCTSWLKSYNKDHDLDRGFLDYNLDVNAKDEYGHYLESYATNDNFFDKLNANGCDCKVNKNSDNIGIVGTSKNK